MLKSVVFKEITLDLCFRKCDDMGFVKWERSGVEIPIRGRLIQ